MHISDGVLPPTVAIAGYVATIAITGYGIRKVDGEKLPKVAVVTSSFFVASLVHVPLGPTSVHLILPGLVGIILGESAFVAVALGLLLQSVLFQFGGLTSLGANALMMGIPALSAGGVFRLMKKNSLKSHIIAGAFAGGLATVMAAILLALFLFFAGEDFFGVAKLALAAHLPVILVETAIAAFTVSFLYKVKPELL